MSFALLSRAGRSRLMSRIRSTNTAPERVVRCTAFSMGFRFRIHDPRLPGKPDIVFRAKRKVVFVNGCFWHQHRGCKDCQVPAKRTAYWTAKFQATKLRDRQARAALRRAGWSVLTIWECETRQPARLRTLLAEFLTD